MSQALFLGFGAMLVASSLMVVLHKNAVTSALFLVLAFCSLAGVYLVLHAEFIGMVQIIVYAGAIMVLFLFVIMYLNLRDDIEARTQGTVRRVVGWLIGGSLLAVAVVFFTRHWGLGPVTPEGAPSPGNTQALGQLLYSRFLFPFEITSIVLLVAMVGAVVIARGRPTGTESAAALRERRRHPERNAAPVAAPAPSQPPAPEGGAA